MGLHDDDDDHHNDEEEEELPEVFPPYLPPKDPSFPEYTLVLDLDETLIHFDSEDKLNDSFDAENNDSFNYSIRSGLASFLRELSKYYELVIYTAAMSDYADYIINQVDPNRLIKHRMYR
mmetsp:Transcript_39812/g.28759  ORF Transcript_39812/g.28759 Transcript_39812/m.28759 type:complete len:120 (-) Transcript_39812:347-706(-)